MIASIAYDLKCIFTVSKAHLSQRKMLVHEKRAYIPFDWFIDFHEPCSGGSQVWRGVLDLDQRWIDRKYSKQCLKHIYDNNTKCYNVSQNSLV